MQNIIKKRQQMAENLVIELNKRPIHEIRQLARAVGAQANTTEKKDELISKIMDIATGKSTARVGKLRGVKPRSQEYDKALAAEVLRCKELYLKDDDFEENDYVKIFVESGKEFKTDNEVDGFLVYLNDAWHLLGDSDIFVDESLVDKHKLRVGDFVKGKYISDKAQKLYLNTVDSIFGVDAGGLRERPIFERLAIEQANETLNTADGNGDIFGKLINVIAPIGKGHRVIISGGNGTGKSWLLRSMAKKIANNDQNMKVVYLAVDITFEDMSFLRSNFTGKEVFTSTFDVDAPAHILIADIACECVKRYAELNYDVLFVIDDLTKLTLAYNAGKFVTNELSTFACVATKKILACAKNIKGGGSVTILTALNSDDATFNSLIYDVLIRFASVNITLSDTLARMHVYPALDLARTYTVGNLDFVSSENKKLANSLRDKTLEEALAILKG